MADSFYGWSNFDPWDSGTRERSTAVSLKLISRAGVETALLKIFSSFAFKIGFLQFWTVKMPSQNGDR